MTCGVTWYLYRHSNESWSATSEWSARGVKGQDFPSRELALKWLGSLHMHFSQPEPLPNFWEHLLEVEA